MTSASLDIQQGRLAGATVSGLKARMIRRDGITKVEELRVTLPGLTALALDGFVDAQKDGLQFDGNVVMRSANLNEFVQWLRPGNGAFAETVPGAVALNGALRVRPKKFDLSNASVDIAGERLDGSFAYDATPSSAPSHGGFGDSRVRFKPPRTGPARPRRSGGQARVYRRRRNSGCGG